jgi:predicted DNA-binding transcriptional regulator AlpA
MRTSTTAIRMTPQYASANQLDSQLFADREQSSNPMPPQSMTVSHSGNGHGAQSLRMYTEEQVATMLQVSLSQLRKWRMKKNGGRQLGPPFRKIGRLVRYPESALLAYINSE